ncbi:effector-associated constant component EACC1 [Actinomadura rubrisoli]|uniref:Uncharacterized protein n=1 Tax=Actinomadura rubrisoli TaxID=2530368 RepID=A0A4V2YU73_9ACTN|nr:hypothetical protein [Actinomadura rubrisoli]TDD76497.1 hypothetical protein E1298_30870 [Actinomadura rubrisoli]
MTINVRIDGDSADDELRSLHQWLLREPVIYQDMDLKLVSKQPEQGQMGAALDLITLTVTSTLQLPSVIDAINGWRRTRRRETQITVERGDVKVTITGADPEAVIKALSLAEKDE